MDRLQQFLTTDTRSRGRAGLVSMGAGFAFGVLARIFDYPFEVSAYGAAATVCAVYFYQAWLYCRPLQRSVRDEWPLVGRRWYLIAAGVTGVLLAILPEGSIEAAVLDRRLRELTRDPKLSPRDAEEVEDSLQRARERGVVLSSTTKMLVRDAVKTSALEDPRTPFTDAASALVRYVREAPVPKSTSGPSEAEVAMNAAAQYTVTFLRDHARNFAVHNFALGPDRSAVEMAISLLTRAIQLAGNNTNLKSAALLTRANLYMLLLEPDEALADAEASEKLGVADLPLIVAVEGEALLDRGMRQDTPEDLKRAVELLTLRMKLPPPLAFASEPQLVFLDRLDALTERARAYYGLEQYTAAIEDSKQILSLLPQASDLSEEVRQRSLQRAYVLVIGSYLHLGEFAKALSAASEWERRSNAGTEARRLRQTIESPTFDAQAVLIDIDRFIYHP